MLEDSDITQSKAFLRSFVKRIVINGKTAEMEYNLPMPPEGKRMQTVVLPIDTLGGARGNRTLISTLPV